MTEVFEKIGRAVKDSSYFEGITIRWTFKEIDGNNITPLMLVLHEEDLRITNPSCAEAEQVIDLVLITTSPDLRQSHSKLALCREQLILLMDNLNLDIATLVFDGASGVSLCEFNREKNQNQKYDTVLGHVVGLKYKVSYYIGDNNGSI